MEYLQYLIGGRSFVVWKLVGSAGGADEVGAVVN